MGRRRRDPEPSGPHRSAALVKKEHHSDMQYFRSITSTRAYKTDSRWNSPRSRCLPKLYRKCLPFWRSPIVNTLSADVGILSSIGEILHHIWEILPLIWEILSPIVEILSLFCKILPPFVKTLSADVRILSSIRDISILSLIWQILSRGEFHLVLCSLLSIHQYVHTYYQ